MTCSHPPIETATDPVHSHDDLRLRWLALMSPLGFGDRTLWMAFLGPDRRMQKMLTPMPARTYADWELVFGVVVGLRDTLKSTLDAGTTVAFLLTRPGSGPVNGEDLHWADMVTGAAEMYRVPLEPFFRANDTSLVEVSARPSS